MKFKTKIMDELAVKRALTRLSFEIIEKSPAPENIVIIGIKTRGVAMARILSANIASHSGISVPTCELDITLYRDDIDQAYESPEVKEPHFGVDITGKEVIIADDVLFTGRTIRAAIDAIFSQGRPGKIGLAVLIDRGHRELPIRPDYVGKNVPTSLREVIKVNFDEFDGKTNVELYERED